MEVNLTWDLFVIVFFVVILSYSFVIGKDGTVKLLLSSYMSLIAADALGNLLSKFFFTSEPIIKLFSLSQDPTALVITKISIFIIAMVTFAVKGAYEITMPKENATAEFFLTLLFGSLSAVFLISGILVFTSGGSLIAGGVAITESNISAMYNQSYIVRTIVLNYSLWFALPMLAFLIFSLFRKSE